MSEQDHRRVEQLIDHYFAGTLPAAQHAELREHLRACDPCRTRYDQLALAEQRVVGVNAAQSLANQRVLDAIMAAPGVLPVSPARRWHWLTLALAPATAIAAVFALVLFIQPMPESQRLVARGTGEETPEVGIGVAAVDPASDSVYDARQTEGVALSHRLRFSYSNSTGGAQFLFVFGVDDSLNPYWYFPLPEEKSSQPIELGPAVRQRMLPYETELARRHHGGRLRVVALFSAQAIELSAVEAVLAEARGTQRPLEQVRWPHEPIAQIVELMLVEGASP